MHTIITISFSLLLVLFSYGDHGIPSTSCQEREGVRIFNGKNLEGWTGDKEYWTVKNGQLVGSTGSKKDPEEAKWLVTEDSFSNFDLSLWVKLEGDRNRNSGVYYRGQWNEDGFVVGYEFDIGGWGGEKELWWGELHDPYRREDLWINMLSIDELKKLYNKKGWNYVRIRVEGNHFQHWLNGTKTVDWYEEDESIQKSGFIGFQLHNESKFEVRYRDIMLIPLSP